MESIINVKLLITLFVSGPNSALQTNTCVTSTPTLFKSSAEIQECMHRRRPHFHKVSALVHTRVPHPQEHEGIADVHTRFFCQKLWKDSASKPAIVTLPCMLQSSIVPDVLISWMAAFSHETSQQTHSRHLTQATACGCSSKAANCCC